MQSSATEQHQLRTHGFKINGIQLLDCQPQQTALIFLNHKTSKEAEPISINIGGSTITEDPSAKHNWG